MFKIKQFTN